MASYSKEELKTILDHLLPGDEELGKLFFPTYRKINNIKNKDAEEIDCKVVLKFEKREQKLNYLLAHKEVTINKLTRFYGEDKLKSIVPSKVEPKVERPLRIVENKDEKTTVINLKGKKGKEIVNGVYIGRSMYMGGWKLPKSKWHNPFSVKEYGREEALTKYKQYILKNEQLMGEIEELRGKVLECWCKPEKCHGDILIEILNKK